MIGLLGLNVEGVTQARGEGLATSRVVRLMARRDRRYLQDLQHDAAAV